ncbi:MAG: sugar-binding protein [Prolixibacteraceae bacterium]
MKKFFTLILFVAAFAIVSKAQVQYQVPYVTTAPNCDGYIDDTEDPWTADWIANAQLTGTTTESTVEWQLAHDDDFIYIAIQIADPSPYNDATAIANSYERDCAEVFFAMDTIDDAAGAYVTGDWQIRFQREAEEGAYVDGGDATGTGIADLIASADFVWGVETGTSEYVLEAAFPFSVLTQDADFDGEFMKFELQVADNTTGAGSGRTQQSFWLKPTDQQWHNTLDFNVIQLMEAPNSNKQLANTGSAFVQNEVLKVKNVNGVVNVYDLRGAIVRTATVNGSASINISDLKSGMYVVKGANLSAKIVK